MEKPGFKPFSERQLSYFIRTLVLDPNIFAPVVTSYGIDHLSLSAMFLYINLVQKKSLIYVLLV
jgi:hypothetical protein